MRATQPLRLVPTACALAFDTSQQTQPEPIRGREGLCVGCRRLYQPPATLRFLRHSKQLLPPRLRTIGFPVVPTALPLRVLLSRL